MNQTNEGTPFIDPALPHQRVVFRSEHSRSLEDAEALKARQTLIELGIAIPLDQVDTLHGRTAFEGDDQWAVDPAYQNGGQVGDRENMHDRSNLYTGTEATARAYAERRAKEAKQMVMTRAVADRYRDLDPTPIRQATYEAKLAAWQPKGPDDDGNNWWNKKPQPPLDGEWTEEELQTVANRDIGMMSSEEQDALFKEASLQVAVEIHNIRSIDDDAVIINSRRDVRGFLDSQLVQYKAAVEALLPPLSEGAPTDYMNRRLAVLARELLLERLSDSSDPPRRIVNDEISRVAEETGYSVDLIRSQAAAINAREFIADDAPRAVWNFIGSSNDITVESMRARNVPISNEYVAAFMRRAHIVGIKQDASNEFGSFEIVSLADMKLLQTDQQVERLREKVSARYGVLASGLHSLIPEVQQTTKQGSLFTVLSDTHASPKTLVEAAASVEGFSEVFAADTGTWEGFTLAQHTETVLRNFEENYADILPYELLGVMRLAIIAHDIGKPEAAAKDEAYRQKAYNQVVGRRFFDALELNTDVTEFVQNLTGEGMTLIEEIIRYDDDPAVVVELVDRARTELARLGIEQPTPAQIQGYVDLCEILMTCDGGAYTSMSTTDWGKNNLVRNHGSFDQSFVPPTGITKRDIKLRNGDASARLEQG